MPTITTKDGTQIYYKGRRTDSGPLSAQLVEGAVLKTYKGFPHGMPTTNADEINADLLAFIKGEMAVTA